MQGKRLIIPLLFSLLLVKASAQTLGGSTTFSFLKVSNTPQLTALGGINISNQSADIGLSFNNPSLLRSSMHTQANLVFNAFYAGIRNYHLWAGYRSEKLKTNFAFGVNYFNYGDIPQTDAAGTVMGEFRPIDYVVQLSASREYMEKWHYGASLKFIHSAYGIYRSSGAALDIGISYHDTANLLQASLLLKNMGFQFNGYANGTKEELPFDIQLGISKRLKNAPFQFSLTLHHLQGFDTRYSDSIFNQEEGIDDDPDKSHFFDKLFRHIVLATQVYITDKVEISAGYNYLRRKELNVGSTGNGLNGFSLGLGILTKKIQFRYAWSYYQSNRAWHQFGLNLQLNQLIGKGK